MGVLRVSAGGVLQRVRGRGAERVRLTELRMVRAEACSTGARRRGPDSESGPRVGLPAAKKLTVYNTHYLFLLTSLRTPPNTAKLR